MKFFRLILLVAVSAGIWSCQNPATETSSQAEVAEDSLEIATPQATIETPADISAQLIEKAFGDEALVRGVRFGDALEKVRASETLELFEDEKQRLGYTYEAPSMQSVDVVYLADEQNRVKNISVDMYANTPAEARQLEQAVAARFTEKYGQPVSPNVWELPGGGRVSIKLINRAPDNGLEVRYAR